MNDRSLPVERTASPVTQQALVDVKRASIADQGFVPTPRHHGCIKPAAPTRISTAYQKHETRAG
jgi:hypothetical protein